MKTIGELIITRKKPSRLLDNSSEILTAKINNYNSTIEINWGYTNDVRKIEIFTISGIKVSERIVSKLQQSLTIELPLSNCLYTIKAFIGNRVKIINV